MIYDHPPDPDELEPTRRRASAPRSWLLPCLVAMVAIALVGHYFLDRNSRSQRPVQARPQADVAAAEPDVAVPVAAPPESAPTAPRRLDGSDAAVRATLGLLSGRPEWQAWLGGEDLVRRAVAAAGAVSEGRSPRFAFEGWPFTGRFAVERRGTRLFVSASSFARYDGVAGVARDLDAAKVAAVWRLLHPLAAAAWAEIAPDDRTLDQMVARAIDHLLATPQPRGEIEVVADGAVYRFADRRLEAASPAQKHLLRMGAANAAAVLRVLGGLRPLLEI